MSPRKPGGTQRCDQTHAKVRVGQARAFLDTAELVHGRPLSRDLARLLDIKDGAHYGLVYVSGQKASAAIRQARRLLDAAQVLVN